MGEQSAGLSSPEKQLMLLLVPPTSNRRGTHEMVSMLASRLDSSQWSVESMDVPEDCRGEAGKAALETIAARKPAGLIFSYPFPEHQDLIRLIVEHRIPLVTYNRDFSADGAVGVVVDTRNVAQAIVDRLWSMGKRRFAVLSVKKESPSITQFCQTVAQLVTERGGGEALKLLLFPFTNSERPSDEMMRSLAETFDPEDRPDAAVCAEFYSLSGISTWLAIHPKVRVPEDVAVASFERPSQVTLSRLTGSLPGGKTDSLGMMKASVSLIDEMISGQVPSPLVRMVSAVIDDSVPKPPPVIRPVRKVAGPDGSNPA